jgi:hypothetical protein
MFGIKAILRNVLITVCNKAITWIFEQVTTEGKEENEQIFKEKNVKDRKYNRMLPLKLVIGQSHYE